MARTRVGCSIPIIAASSRNAFSYFAVYSCTLTPSRAELRMILSSTSVMFMTWWNVVATLTQESAQQVDSNEGAEIADVSVIVDSRSARVHADFGVAERVKFLDSATTSCCKGEEA